MKKMVHPDSQDPAQRGHQAVDYDGERRDRFGERVLESGTVPARSLKDIMADIHHENTVVLKDLGDTGAHLGEESLSGGPEENYGVNFYSLNLRDNFYITGDKGPSDVDDLIGQIDLLRVYDPRGASAEWGGVEDPWSQDHGFLEDSRTFGIANVVVEIEREDIQVPRNEVSLGEPSDYADEVAEMLETMGYETVVRHEVSFGNDYVFGSKNAMVK